MKLAKARVHFIGIGGIGMCGLAELLHNMGAKVSGSDLQESAQTQRLSEMGIQVSIGHAAQNVEGREVVVYSSAVLPANPEFAAAKKQKIPLIARAEALAEIMRLRRGVAIGGSHGKTTTTSMTASIFLEGKLNPTIVIGGRLDLIKSTALLGTGEWLVAEADESDGTFLRLSPEIAVVTNVDNDHLDHYGSIAHVQKAFVDFANRIPFYGLAIVCGDDPLAREAFKEFGKRIVYYGFNNENDVVLSRTNDGFQLTKDGKKLGFFALHVPGEHNALNATAAIVAGMEAGLSFDICAKGLRSFRGVDRRFQHRGHKSGVDVYDDYGHHPTEIRAVLQAMRERFPDRRLVTVFQPHRYSRTKLCWDQFLKCFDQTDLLYLMDIYSAGEQPIPEVSTERFIEKIKKQNRKVQIHYVKGRGDQGLELVQKSLQAKDILLTLGAGDIWKLGVKYLAGK